MNYRQETKQANFVIASVMVVLHLFGVLALVYADAAEPLAGFLLGDAILAVVIVASRVARRLFPSERGMP